ncbi:hypothetical protein BDQ17DRAFT_286983 [Cyathus striatus]|nr:hypothetical protein BDQ17DRAFT_286983 [Cyathus striatus]
MRLVKSFANRSGDASISTSYPLPAVALRDHNSLSELGSSAHELPGSSTNLSKAAIVSVHVSSSRENLQGDGKDSQGQNEFELSYLSSGFSRVPATSLRSTDSIININKDSQHACNDQGLFDTTGGLSYSSPHSLASTNNPSDENIVSVPLSDALAARRNLPSHTQTTDHHQMKK